MTTRPTASGDSHPDQPNASAQVIDLASTRKRKRPEQPALAISYVALHRYNDLARQIHVHESRRISAWEAWAVVYQPEQLGLGHGPMASLLLNPAV